MPSPLRTYRWLATAALLLFTAWPAWADDAAPAADRPNIIVVMADDMGYSDLGCYGGEIETPHIDRLAAGGLRFTQFYNTGRCCPTRASLLTGLYSHQVGIGHMARDDGLPSYQGHLSRQCVTIAEVLRDGGYHTLMTGKWHVGSAPGQLPLDRGFEKFYGSGGGGGDHFGKVRGIPIMLNNTNVDKLVDWYSTDAFTDYAVRFIDQAAKDKERPFFLYVAYTAPHWPLHALPEDMERYRGRYRQGWDELRLSRHARMIELGIVDSAWPLSPRDPSARPWEAEPFPDEMQLRMEVYAAQIDRVDQGVGRITQKLHELGLEQNTLVLFLSDNGCSPERIRGGDNDAPTGTPMSYRSCGQSWANACNTPLRMFKSWVHEGGIATPLVAYWPDVIHQHGALTHEPGHVIDLMATCLDVAGVEYPREHGGEQVIPLEGKSLLPILEGGRRKPHEALFWEHEGNRAVRQGKWKLVSKYPGDWELYDLEADRTELHNLASEQPERAAQMAESYNAWAQRTGVVDWKELRGEKSLPQKPQRAEKQPPNVLLIVSDDQGYADLGCFGGQEVRTPNLDRLAAGGARLTSFYVTWPACTPSRSGLLTGRYPQRNGLYDMIRNDEVNYGHRFTEEEYAVSPEMTLGMDLREVTLADPLSAAGYACGVVGKWDGGRARRFLPLQRGFDFYYGFANTGIDYWTHERYGVHSMFRGNELTKEDQGLYATDLFRREALRFIEENAERPFFLYVPFNAPHGASNLDKDPYQAPDDALSEYAARGFDPADKRTEYMAMVTRMDDAIGDMLDTLDALGLAKNTLVIFFSDNGGASIGDNTPLRGHKAQMWEGGIRVPCIVRFPGHIPPGTVSDEFLTALEVFPTVMAATGTEPPQDVKFDGFDMLPILAEGTKSPRQEMFWQRRSEKAARVGNYKWVDMGQRGSGLFDLASDIGEQHDLSQEKPEVLARVKKRFETWTADMEASEPRGPFRNY